ncbi:hypothetical protein, partial [Listeria welshimeri]|uniref:hypothetical protein n=1 Tax=Listeria welshimeri TaxID=1643 RepID=UPI001E43A63F
MYLKYGTAIHLPSSVLLAKWDKQADKLIWKLLSQSLIIYRVSQKVWIKSNKGKGEVICHLLTPKVIIRFFVV